jgi:hypothetical protein
MTTPAANETRPRVAIGERVELAQYTIPAGERVLQGQRVNGVVRIIDRPLNGTGRAYLVERGLEEDGPRAYAALQALIADYKRLASQLADVPMATSLLRRELETQRDNDA